MGSLARNLAQINDRIAAACRRAGRERDSVSLIAVSKTFSSEAVREVAAAGQVVFGESKLQEAESKIEMLPSHLQWHFIGRIQRNKLRKILPRFDVIHAIDSLALATAANQVAQELGLFPKVFLQVNIGGEATKGGFEPAVLHEGIMPLLELERLEIQGLMCIPPPAPEPAAARPWFVALRHLRDELQERATSALPYLSMGMSDDFEVAIEEGATHVRVGSAIFGDRSYRIDDELG